MTNHIVRLFLGAALLVPFVLGNKGCEPDTQGGPGNSKLDAGDEAAGKRGAELELCDTCKGPAPGAPNYQCKDGSVGGPVCAKKDLGDCGWVFRACPEEGHDGGEDPRVCGSRGSEPCPDGQYCKLDATCGATDRGGACVAQPDACDQQYEPVCGCDGKTYGNACIANAAGVSVSADGECGQGGKTCGGIAAISCGDGEFCNYEPAAGGQGCDGTIADAAGVCQIRPDACTEQYEPVCGCDGRTYGNACAAHASGASVATQGECAAKAVSCDRREARCRRAEPICPAGQVVEIIDQCFGGCVPIESCVCDEPADCSSPDQYTCHKYKGRCGPYVQ